MLLEPPPPLGTQLRGVTGLRLLQAEDNFPTSQQVLHALRMESWATEGRRTREKRLRWRPARPPHSPYKPLCPPELQNE